MSVVRCAFYVVSGLAMVAGNPHVAAMKPPLRVGHPATTELSANPGLRIRTRDTQSVEAIDLTVRLFSTGPLRTVEVVGNRARVRLCGACAAQVLSSTVMVSAAGNRVSVAGRTVAEVLIDGEVKATTADGRVAQVAGRWSLSAGRDGLHVLVQVPSERYVMAVLQAEAAADEPPESLEALAVVVRSFAMQNPQRHGLEGVCDSTHCQALRFAAVPARVRAAVEATAGETLWYGGASGAGARQVSGYFSQDCGGMTEDAAAAWGGPAKPWLVAHVDPFCVHEPALWHAELSAEQVREALAGEGLKVPAVVTGVRVVQRDASGRVAELEVVGSGQETKGRGRTDGLKPVPFKAMMGAGTLRFALDRAYGWNELRSDAYRVSVVGGRVVFEGRGFGHGVGLCQAGARAMAAGGRGYREILGFYFPGTGVRVLEGDAGWAARRGNGWGLRAVSEGNEWVAAGDAAWGKARAVFPVGRDLTPVVTVYPTTELFREATGEPGWELAATRGLNVGVQPGAVVMRALEDPTHAAIKLRHEWGTRHRSGSGSGPGFGSGEGGAEELLLHEFLHVLVESEATDTAPLWLREGLVEVLAGERCAAGGSVVAGPKYRGLSTPAAKARPPVEMTSRGAAKGQPPVEMTNGGASKGRPPVKMTTERAAKSRPSVEMANSNFSGGAGSWEESQRAHAAACARVERAVGRYGFAAVRGWLRDGVPADVIAEQ